MLLTLLINLQMTPKLMDIVDNAEGYLILQQDLHQLGRRAEERQIEVNTEKCEVCTLM